MIWQGSVATKGGCFLSEELLETLPQLLLQFYHTVLYLDIGTAHSLWVSFPVLWLHLQSDLSTVQRYLNLFPVTSLPIATWSTAQASLFWFLSICEEGFFFFGTKTVLRRIQTELHSPKAIFFVGSFNAKLTSKDERFQDHRNFFSHTHISYGGQTTLRYYIGLLIHINVLPLKFLCPVKT